MTHSVRMRNSLLNLSTSYNYDDNRNSDNGDCGEGEPTKEIIDINKIINEYGGERTTTRNLSSSL